jgi:hypothetical protein
MEVPVNVYINLKVHHGVTEDYSAHTIFYINDPSLDINLVSRLVIVVDNCTKITAELKVVILYRQQTTSLQS